MASSLLPNGWEGPCVSQFFYYKEAAHEDPAPAFLMPTHATASVTPAELHFSPLRTGTSQWQLATSTTRSTVRSIRFISAGTTAEEQQREVGRTLAVPSSLSSAVPSVTLPMRVFSSVSLLPPVDSENRGGATRAATLSLLCDGNGGVACEAASHLCEVRFSLLDIATATRVKAMMEHFIRTCKQNTPKSTYMRSIVVHPQQQSTASTVRAARESALESQTKENMPQQQCENIYESLLQRNNQHATTTSNHCLRIVAATTSVCEQPTAQGAAKSSAASRKLASNAGDRGLVSSQPSAAIPDVASSDMPQQHLSLVHTEGINAAGVAPTWFPTVHRQHESPGDDIAASTFSSLHSTAPTGEETVAFHSARAARLERELHVCTQALRDTQEELQRCRRDLARENEARERRRAELQRDFPRLSSPLRALLQFDDILEPLVGASSSSALAAAMVTISAPLSSSSLETLQQTNLIPRTAPLPPSPSSVGEEVMGYVERSRIASGDTFLRSQSLRQRSSYLSTTLSGTTAGASSSLPLPSYTNSGATIDLNVSGFTPEAAVVAHQLLAVEEQEKRPGTPSILKPTSSVLPATRDASDVNAIAMAKADSNVLSKPPIALATTKPRVVIVPFHRNRQQGGGAIATASRHGPFADSPQRSSFKTRAAAVDPVAGLPSVLVPPAAAASSLFTTTHAATSNASAGTSSVPASMSLFSCSSTAPPSPTVQMAGTRVWSPCDCNEANQMQGHTRVVNTGGELGSNIFDSPTSARGGIERMEAVNATTQDLVAGQSQLRMGCSSLPANGLSSTLKPRSPLAIGINFETSESMDT